MKVKRILMSAPMVQATLREIEAPGTGKTQTRRIMKSQPVDTGVSWQFQFMNKKSGIWANYPYESFSGREFSVVEYCPYGKPGDLLYLRETWAPTMRTGNSFHVMDGPGDDVEKCLIKFRADNDANQVCGKWKTSIHMPRWASRITLEITDVRAERLQDISEADAMAEGVYQDEDRPEEHDYCNNEWMCPRCAGTGLFTAYSFGGAMPDTDCNDCETNKQRFKNLFNSINGPESWEANPWVWAVSFKPHLINVDAFIKAMEA